MYMLLCSSCIPHAVVRLTGQQALSRKGPPWTLLLPNSATKQCNKEGLGGRFSLSQHMKLVLDMLVSVSASYFEG